MLRRPRRQMATISSASSRSTRSTRTATPWISVMNSIGGVLQHGEKSDALFGLAVGLGDRFFTSALDCDCDPTVLGCAPRVAVAGRAAQWSAEHGNRQPNDGEDMTELFRAAFRSARRSHPEAQIRGRPE